MCDCAQLGGRPSGRGQAAPLLPGAGLAGVGRVVVGHGAGGGADLKVCPLATSSGHGGVRRREARVRLLVLQIC